MASKETQRLLVAAIDFGTTFSGWAFLFKHQYDSDPSKVYAKNWNNGSNISTKTPTTILIKPDGNTVEAFGYEAEDRYADLAAENKHQPYFYFRRFKMMLNDKINFKRDIELDDENGKQLPAIKVFSLAIRCLKEDLLKECRQQIVDEDLHDQDIFWVLTVPAIWNDAAKQFMRESAVKAGITTDRLTIALEPEAASLFCKHLSVQKTVTKSGFSFDTFSPGSKYIVLDAGGGTIDITVHEVLHDNGLRELYRASGGAWGGTKIDEKFNQFLIKIFGAPIMVKFRKRHMDDFIDLFRHFEVKKREVSLYNDKTFQLRLPASLVEMFKVETDEELKETISQMSFAGGVSLLPGNKLKLDANVMKNFYREVLYYIEEHLSKLMLESVVKGSNFILMVGGFSESAILQETVRTRFSRMKVIAAPEASIVVLKGAAIFGHREDVIEERIARHTYGFIGLTLFQEGFHPESSLIIKGGKRKCKDAFFKLVEIGKPLRVNERREWPGNRLPANDEKHHITFPLMASDQGNPKIKTDGGNIHVGTLTVEINNMSVPYKERRFRITGIFGQTEIKMEALELSTGHLTAATFDALG